jgi:hypothetical protein
MGVGDDDGGTVGGIKGGSIDGVASREAGSGTVTGTGALPVASRPKAGSETGLVRWGRGWCDGVGDGDGGRGRRRGHYRRRRGQRRGRRDVEGGVRGTEGGGVDGAASREAAAQRAGNLGSLTVQTKILL